MHFFLFEGLTVLGVFGKFTILGQKVSHPTPIFLKAPPPPKNLATEIARVPTISYIPTLRATTALCNDQPLVKRWIL